MIGQGQFNQRKPSATAFQNWANKKKLGSISPNRNHPFNMVNSQQNNMRNQVIPTLTQLQQQQSNVIKKPPLNHAIQEKQDEASLLNKYRSNLDKPKPRLQHYEQQLPQSNNIARIVPKYAEGYQIKEQMTRPIEMMQQPGASRAQLLVQRSQLQLQHQQQAAKPSLLAAPCRQINPPKQTEYGIQAFFNNYRNEQQRNAAPVINSSKKQEYVEISDVSDDCSDVDASGKRINPASLIAEIDSDDSLIDAQDLERAIQSGDSSISENEDDQILPYNLSSQKFEHDGIQEVRNPNHQQQTQNVNGVQSKFGQPAQRNFGSVQQSAESFYGEKFNQQMEKKTPFTFAQRNAQPTTNVKENSFKQQTALPAKPRLTMDEYRKKLGMSPFRPGADREAFVKSNANEPRDNSKLTVANKMHLLSDNFGAVDMRSYQNTKKIIQQKKREKEIEEKNKKEELERKRRMLIEKKKKREQAKADKELDQLFAQNVQQEDEEPLEPKELTGLESLLNGGTANGPEIGKPENSNQMAFLPAQEAFDAIRRTQRLNNSHNVDDLLHPIISLNLVSEFHAESKSSLRKNLPHIPDVFDSHEQYRDVWTQLFLYETYCQLLSAKSQSDTDLIAIVGDRKEKRFSDKCQMFKVLLENVDGDPTFAHLHVQECQNVTVKDDEGKEHDDVAEYRPTTVQEYKDACRHIDLLKEYDLVLLSDKPIDCRGRSVKTIINEERMLEMHAQKHKGLFIGVISQRRKPDTTHIKIKIEKDVFRQYLQQFTTKGKHLMHCYYFDSLSTSVREFKTIKRSEFFPGIDRILNPDRLINSGFASIEGPTLNPQMQTFLQTHSQVFNKSQLNALSKVTQMKSVDLMLIQGPPGTGKTHTIHGLVAMLAACQNKKILVCTPSNAAIDEIVLRLVSNGGYHEQFDQLKNRVVRIGALDYDPLPVVKDHTLDAIVEREIQARIKYVLQPGETVDDVERKLKRLRQIVAALTLTRKKVLLGDPVSKLQRNLKPAYDESKATELSKEFWEKYTTEKAQLNQLENMRKMKEREIKALQSGEHITKKKRQEIQRNVIRSAQIVCSTLSMSASEMLEFVKKGEFEYLIVDEACQSVELTNLIPFMHQPKKVILVGDHNQLPATVFSENCHETGYSRSFFERMLATGIQQTMLTIQYRMHPEIRKFPSHEFYADKLEDAPGVIEREKPGILEVVTKDLQVKPSVFFDLKFANESTHQTSKQNEPEAKFIVALLQILADNLRKNPGCTDRNLGEKIGIISPYKSQVSLIKILLHRHAHKFKSYLSVHSIEVNTVDAFQGREKDFIIISTVRSQSLGFLRDHRRMNVAITRARHFLWIVGNSTCLRQDAVWQGLIEKGAGVRYTFEGEEQVMDRQGEVNVERVERALKQGKVQGKKKEQYRQGKQQQQRGGEELGGGSGKVVTTTQSALAQLLIEKDNPPSTTKPVNEAKDKKLSQDEAKITHKSDKKQQRSTLKRHREETPKRQQSNHKRRKINDSSSQSTQKEAEPKASSALMSLIQPDMDFT